MAGSGCTRTTSSFPRQFANWPSTPATGLKLIRSSTFPSLSAFPALRTNGTPAHRGVGIVSTAVANVSVVVVSDPTCAL